MANDLFAGIRVSNYAAALEWYGRLFGSPPSFVPTDGEAVWELAEHRYVFTERRPEDAGHARHLLFVDDLDAPGRSLVENWSLCESHVARGCSQSKHLPPPAASAAPLAGLRAGRHLSPV